ncbi:MAG: ATP-binding cassette domain-containing protein [Chlorobi bacterium]|nr:ATP-binding cassette domain-containing protein [Chlorobiota bacterium]
MTNREESVRTKANQVLVETWNLCKSYPMRSRFLTRVVGWVKAVDNVSLTIRRGETLGLVGESGCGKTTLGHCILQLIPATSGKVFFEGVDITALDKTELRRMRKDMQIIFQDPYSSLNPRMTVGGMLREVLHFHNIVDRSRMKDKVDELLKTVGLSPSHAYRYPHEFSGGQRQRIGIARALALEPKFIVCDEPISALDVSIQSQILNLLQQLQEQYQLTYLFIAHDLAVVEHISNRVAVMYLGRIVEIADYRQIYENPLHPYTLALMSAVPIPDPKAKRDRIVLPGEVPDPTRAPSGCAFHPRCPEAMPECSSVSPVLREHDDGHKVSCLKYSTSWPEQSGVSTVVPAETITASPTQGGALADD